jgi:hypothetical protein
MQSTVDLSARIVTRDLSSSCLPTWDRASQVEEGNEEYIIGAMAAM